MERKRGLYIPGAYAREMRERNEAMRRGDIPPKVTIYDPSNPEDKKRLTKDLRAASGSLLLPWDAFHDRIKKKADKKGVYKDTSKIYTEDILKLDGFQGSDADLRKAVEERTNPNDFLVVHYPWENMFVTVPREEEFHRITQSREYGITSERAKESIKDEHFLVIGGGVGGRVGVALAGAGAKHVKVVDKSPITPHRGSRVTGNFITQMGENQASFYVKQMLQLNPFGNYEAVPQYIGNPTKEPGTADMEALIDWSTFIYQEIDQLEKKGLIHKMAQEKRKLCAQLTDAGTGIILLFDDPRFNLAPFNGRYTPEVQEEMSMLDPNDKAVFLDKAVEIFMGRDNITDKFARSLQVSRKAGFGHIPQSGRAAGKVGSRALDLYCAIIDGEITGPVEWVLD